MRKEFDTKEVAKRRELYMAHAEPSESDKAAAAKVDAWVRKQTWYKGKRFEVKSETDREIEASGW